MSKPERWRAVDDDVVVLVHERLERAAKRRLAAFAFDQLELGADEILGRGEDGEVWQAGNGEDDLARAAALDEHVVERQIDFVFGDPYATGGIALGIGVEEKGPAFSDRQRRGEIDRGRRLADATLLIGNRYDV